MEYSGHDIADTVRNVYLNRAGINDTAMLPVINDVYEALQQLLIEHGSPIFKTDFTPITVAAGLTSLSYGTGAGTLPENFVSPLKLYERVVGGLDTSYVPMTEKEDLPKIAQTETLQYWSWNEESINFIGATSAREVLINGYKMLPLLEEAHDKVTISFAKGYLCAKVAAQCALTLSHNQTLADRLDRIAETKLAAMISRYVKKDQAFPVRRRGFRRPSRRI
jgi:hypothetical protein